MLIWSPGYVAGVRVLALQCVPFAPLEDFLTFLGFSDLSDLI